MQSKKSRKTKDKELDPVPVQSFKPIDWNRIKVITLLFISFTLLMGIFHFTRDILVPFVIAVFIFYAINPLVDWFQHLMKIPRLVSILLTVLTSLLVATIIVFLVISSFSGVIRSLEEYQQRIADLIIIVVDWANVKLLPLNVAIDASTFVKYMKNLPFLEWARGVSSGVFSFFGKTVLTVLFFIFLVTGTKLKRKFEEHPESIAFQINQRISKYLFTKTIISLVTGVLVATVLALIGVDFALMFGLLAFLLNFIPSIGSIIATLLPIPIALMQFGPSVQLFLTLALPTSIQFTIGNLIEPKIMGDSLGLHPVVILLAMLLWGALWGIPGMLMAVPIMAILKIILQRYEITNPFAKMLEGDVYHSFKH